MTELNLTRELLEQLTWHWDNQLRPRLQGLTDEEYLWEPVAGAWSIRSRGSAVTAMAAGAGDLVIDWDWPQPEPAPVTTIAWRLGHLIVGVFGARNASHFDGPSADYAGWRFAGTAAVALEQLDEGYHRWIEGVAGLDAQALARPCGPAEGQWAELSMAALVLHIHREVIHHAAEISLLRDLYAHREEGGQ
ncbi:DinB family protein [Aestuariimicrobium ganziense]|uniref:DinB family protein n=1 Tax=Aestuariimicrobium ganziense TaxID=2773677 RepID=UPI001941C8CD|nr:DinB family protein [Aestuariimicrobium ganziense]